MAYKSKSPIRHKLEVAIEDDSTLNIKHHLKRNHIFYLVNLKIDNWKINPTKLGMRNEHSPLWQYFDDESGLAMQCRI